jgi:predicted AAA+ superfamily ATPase
LQQIANGLLDRFCQEVNYQDIQETYRLRSIHTAKNYVNYIEKSYLLRLVTRYSFKSIERQNYRKVYAIDTAFVTDHSDVLQTDSWGWRLENVVCIELLRRFHHQYAEVFYYKDNAFEIDFLVAKNGVVQELIQVSYQIASEKTRQREINGLVQGAKKFNCGKLTLITFSTEEVIEKDNEIINVVPATKWLTENN